MNLWSNNTLVPSQPFSLHLIIMKQISEFISKNCLAYNASIGHRVLENKKTLANTTNKAQNSLSVHLQSSQCFGFHLGTLIMLLC